MGQAAKASLTARADREAATQWELVWTLPVHAHYGGPYTDWLYTSPRIKSGFKKYLRGSWRWGGVGGG